MTIVSKEIPPYTFRLSKIAANIRVRDCATCGKRTKQQQAQDANGKWVEVFRCRTCRTEASNFPACTPPN